MAATAPPSAFARSSRSANFPAPRDLARRRRSCRRPRSRALSFPRGPLDHARLRGAVLDFDAFFVSTSGSRSGSAGSNAPVRKSASAGPSVQPTSTRTESPSAGRLPTSFPPALDVVQVPVQARVEARRESGRHVGREDREAKRTASKPCSGSASRARRPAAEGAGSAPGRPPRRPWRRRARRGLGDRPMPQPTTTAATSPPRYAAMPRTPRLPWWPPPHGPRHRRARQPLDELLLREVSDDLLRRVAAVVLDPLGVATRWRFRESVAPRYGSLPPPALAASTPRSARERVSCGFFFAPMIPFRDG